MLSGSVLSVWDRVEKQLRGGEDGTGQFVRMQVCRLRTNDGQANTIGIIVPNECVTELSNELAEDAESVEEVDLSNELSSATPNIEVKIEPKLEVKIEPKLEFKIEVKIDPETEEVEAKMEFN